VPRSRESQNYRSSSLTTDAVAVGLGVTRSHVTAKLIGEGRSVVIVTPSGCHRFPTRLAAVIGGAQPAADAAIPVDETSGVPGHVHAWNLGELVQDRSS